MALVWAHGVRTTIHVRNLVQGHRHSIERFAVAQTRANNLGHETDVGAG